MGYNIDVDGYPVPEQYGPSPVSPIAAASAALEQQAVRVTVSHEPADLIPLKYGPQGRGRF